MTHPFSCSRWNIILSILPFIILEVCIASAVRITVLRAAVLQRKQPACFSEMLVFTYKTTRRNKSEHRNLCLYFIIPLRSIHTFFLNMILLNIKRILTLFTIPKFIIIRLFNEFSVSRTLKMEATYSSKISVHFHQTTQHYILECIILNVTWFLTHRKWESKRIPLPTPNACPMLECAMMLKLARWRILAE
jgi:hypothetical protein